MAYKQKLTFEEKDAFLNLQFPGFSRYAVDLDMLRTLARKGWIRIHKYKRTKKGTIIGADIIFDPKPTPAEKRAYRQKRKQSQQAQKARRQRLAKEKQALRQERKRIQQAHKEKWQRLDKLKFAELPGQTYASKLNGTVLIMGPSARDRAFTSPKEFQTLVRHVLSEPVEWVASGRAPILVRSQHRSEWMRRLERAA
jgi:hypothetical protein